MEKQVLDHQNDTENSSSKWGKKTVQINCVDDRIFQVHVMMLFDCHIVICSVMNYVFKVNSLVGMTM